MPFNPFPETVRVWPNLTQFAGLDQRMSERMARHPATAALYEFLRFGFKQAWACLFGGIMVAMIIATRYAYPDGVGLHRYDFLFLAALVVQAVLLASRLETMEEAKVILLYHLTGTAMEIFKTAVGSWIYPEPAVFRIGGVPLFTGFMYSCVGSYIFRAWRLFDFRFARHPPLWTLVLLSSATYVNFFAHHYVPDIRLGLFAVSAALFAPAKIHFRVWRQDRSMPLLLGFMLVAFFIWLSENIGTFTRTWVYPNQTQAWSLVSFGKLGSWFLLLIVSYTMVAVVNRPRKLSQPAEPRSTTTQPNESASV